MLLRRRRVRLWPLRLMLLLPHLWLRLRSLPRGWRILQFQLKGHLGQSRVELERDLVQLARLGLEIVAVVSAKPARPSRCKIPKPVGVLKSLGSLLRPLPVQRVFRSSRCVRNLAVGSDRAAQPAVHAPDQRDVVADGRRRLVAAIPRPRREGIRKSRVVVDPSQPDAMAVLVQVYREPLQGCWRMQASMLLRVRSQRFR